MTPEEKRIYNQQYRQENLAKLKQYGQQYAQAHREDKRAYDAQYRAANRDTLREKKRQYYQENRDRILTEQHARYRRRHPRARVKLNPTEKARRQAARLAAYRKTHPDIIHEAQRRHRARKTQARINDLTVAQWHEIKAAYKHRCAYCQRKMQRLEQDHIVALSQGGNNTVSNIVPACRSCNAKKHAGPPPIPIQPLLLTIAPPMKP